MFRARSRSSSFRRTFRGFRGRRRSVTNLKVGRPKVWQAAFFHFDNAAIHDSSVSNNVVTVVAQIPDRIGDSTNANGRVLMQAARKLELGGIVWTAGIDDNRIVAADFPTAGQPFFSDYSMVWAYDRLDASLAPCAINVNWNNTTSPCSVASAAAADDIEDAYPERIIKRFDERRVYGGQSFGLDAPAMDQQTSHIRWRGNLRLRQYLDDSHCLVFHQFNQDTLGFPTSLGTAFWCRGTLYYRWVLGR